MDDVIATMAARLVEVRGVRAVVLGGSRARGAHRPGSDWDLGVYYRGGVDVAGLVRLAGELTGAPVEVAGPGGWGPWVDGGAWLTVDGVGVDWILRDLDRVERVWADCRAGRYEVGVQAGHPLGFWSPAYPGEVALCRVLADPAGEVTALRAETAAYPEPLREALVGAAWEADFSVAAAAKSAPGGDVLHVGLCLSRAFGVLVQSLHAYHRVWCLNEKGALGTAADLPGAPQDLAHRIGTALRGLDPEAVASAADLTAEIRGALVLP
ncbi:nucleotidyltransferase family protein [Streptomyces sp. WMMC940]|uniref:nucleotidyltransferase family protein n=1 Tax=Streptomyces sp. WMMC940 TaxID=3015153 RepID=UPI0022B6D7AD|nr:nucleotidyltransferase domain-containing protein [Streptomyces sp. WMMC940]MCZ7457051.1 nucleotidyltransferase domain-containing protein [Streptomyces sp. WMMC940]